MAGKSIQKVVCIALLLNTLPLTIQAAPPSLLNLFQRRTVEADPNTAYILSEENGPWLILAACFGGEEGARQAAALVLELRRDYNLPAYIHTESYDYTTPLYGSGTRPIQMRHLNGRKYDSFAVLVGEFDSINHPNIEHTLDLLKHAHPKSLDYSKSGRTHQRFAAIREWHKKLVDNEEKKRLGPMGGAFLSRNPLLPDEFFNAPQVDAFVRKLNEKVEFSLLKNPGKYTVVVRIFDGNATVDLGSGSELSKLISNPERLNRGAELAHRMVLALRKQNIPAYEFHDRYRSMVTVGEFDTLGNQTQRREFQYTRAIMQTMQQFSAGRTALQQTSHGTRMAANHIDGIPFDVNPHPIAVPKVSKRSLYAGALEFWQR